MRIQSYIILIVSILISFGLLMVFGTTSAEVIDRDAFTFIPLVKQIFFIVTGVLISSKIVNTNHELLINHAKKLYFVFIALLILVFVPKIGARINGSYRWISFFGATLQPSEFTKVAFPLFYVYLYKHTFKEITFVKFLLWQLVLLVPVALILLEPDNGTAFILIVTMILMNFITKIPLKYWLIPTFGISVCLVTFALQIPYVTARLSSYLHPDSDLLGKGHQAYQAKIAAGAGSMFGRGLGESMQKYHYLPEARSDYIAAIFAEEFGFVGVFFLIAIYALIVSLCMAIAFRTKDLYAHILVVTYTFIIAFGAFLNLGIVSGMLPSKGTNLPFFSCGGSSFLSNLFMLAIILGIETASEKPKLETKGDT